MEVRVEEEVEEEWKKAKVLGKVKSRERVPKHL